MTTKYVSLTSILSGMSVPPNTLGATPVQIIGQDGKLTTIWVIK